VRPAADAVCYNAEAMGSRQKGDEREVPCSFDRAPQTATKEGGAGHNATFHSCMNVAQFYRIEPRALLVLRGRAVVQLQLAFQLWMGFIRKT